MSLKRRIKESAQFSWATLTQPQKTGALVPSSPMLAVKLAELVKETGIRNVIELGPGTGAITSKLIRNGKVRALEFNPEFVTFLKKKYPKLYVKQGDARHLDQYFNPNKPAVIISGIPLRGLPKEDRTQILHSIHSFLAKSTGFYIQFTYDLITRPQTLYPEFRPLSSHYVWANVPPARIHVLEGVFPMKKRILIVEDDPHIRLGVSEALKAEGYETYETADGSQVMALLRQSKPDLVLLDVMLPGKNGYDVCRELRQNKITTPVIMLTAKGQEIDKVVGLELGADDYVTKPFGLRELLARVQAVLRRSTAVADGKEIPVPKVLEFGKIKIEPASLRGTRGKIGFELSPRELKVLLYLHAHAGQAVSRDDLLNHVWGLEYYGTTRTLDQVIVKIRQKLEDDSSEPKYLLTVHGLGYRLDV